VYRETVTFPRSGAPGKPITLRPRQNEKVVITGCDPVTGWTRHKGNIWNASMPWTLGLGRNQVFVDGEVMIEARFPNTAAPGLEMYVADLSPLWPTFGEFSIPDPKNAIGRVTSRLLEGQPDDHWKGALYYGVHYQGWSAQTGVIESSKPGEIVVGDRTRTWWFPRPYGQGGHEEGRGMIVGHLNALDEPGEWHWQDGLLYLIPKTDGEPRQVEAKRRQLAFDLSGREHIRIEGVTLQAASVRMQDSAWCTFDRCDLSHISHFTRHYDIGQVETGRDTLKSGETGLFVGGHDNAFLNCSVRVSAGAGFYLRGYHHTIHNCLIDEVSYTSHYLNAITDAVSDFADYENFLVGGHVITYNTMRNAGRHFFNFYGNGCSTASRTRGPMDYLATLFAHNHLYNGMLQTRDAGFLTGYYGSGGTLNGLHAQVAYNVLHDNYDIAGMRWNVLGHIYLDAGTCHVDVRNNLLWAAPGSLQRALWFNTCCLNCSDRDNVFLPNFARTCAELVPDNFPNGQPFRFGHDFQNPPPLPKWPQLETRLLDAQACTFRSSGLATSDAGLSNLKDGEWFGFDGVDMSQGWQSVIMRFASDVKQLNADKSNRAHPRHRKATDPLVMQAVSNDGTAAEIGKQWTFIRNVKDGSWIRFNEAPLGEGYERFRVVYGKVTDATAWVEVHLDSAGGPLAARVPLSRTDRVRGASIQIYGEATAEVSADAKGTRDVFLVFRTEDKKPVGEFEYFRLERYRGQIALAKDEVKLEVRVGRKDGEKLGEFYPRCTGGQASFREMVATLEPATGTQPLFLVVRSALAEPVGSIAWLRLEKAAQPQDLTALGLPPRVDAQGRMILPAPTHRPRAKPADKYATVIARQAPRPMFLAARSLAGPLAAEPASRSLALAETWDGNLSAAPRSTAWIAYDDHAIHIAVRHPVTDATALRSSASRWGQDNGMEIA
ncbi:MAG: carbohydrate-binding protein, partial [Planctomycetes bacterium]|nr:carbohydrate-binding protein [Planctomycetota bacterium]